MLKKIILILTTITLLITISACSNKTTRVTANKPVASHKLQIVVSFNAMRELTEAVGKEKVDIKTIVPDGTEPHDFEPKASDIEKISNAEIFFYNGLGVESWTENALKAIDNKNLIVVKASEGSNLISSGQMKGKGEYDPHIWLSLKGAESEAKNIMRALIKADSSNKNYYEKNYREFYNKLESLFDEYNKKFSNMKNKSFVTGHAAFAYLCRDFGLKQNSVEDVFADGEPSAKKLKGLTDYCKANRITTIFVEDMISPKVSETLANEVGAKVEKIYTIESNEDNKDYLQSMRDNLEKIYNSLK